MELYRESDQENEIYAVDRMLGIALDIGKSMLECGAQISRVEDAVRDVCLTYGAETVEPWTITSIVQATVKMPDGYHTTQIRRVYATGNDLNRLEQLARLVTEVVQDRPSLDVVTEKYQEICQKKTSTFWLNFIGAFFGTGGYAVFFGGNLWDGLAAGLIGAVMATLFLLLGRRSFNPVAKTVLFSFLSAACALVALKIGLGHNLDKVMIGTIMFFTPGIMLGNSFKDMLCGDLIAGILKLLQALITAVAIAVGYASALWLMGGIL